MDLTNEDVADILALLDSLPYDSLDVETPRFRLTLRRAASGWTQESLVLAEPPPVPANPNGSASGPAPPERPAPQSGIPEISGGENEAAAAGATGGTGDGASDGAGLVAVVTPLPGTFYRAPRPGAAPFTEIGDVVGPDTVVAIVETMKLMNSVHAGTAGRVTRICLENGEFAALGAPLMLIEPDS